MVKDGSVVQIPEETQNRVSQSFPDLQNMKKAERTPILKQKMSSLKTELRKFLSGLKGANYEFDVNGNILDAKLYNTGIREVVEKVTRDKASMLYHSEEIFKNARYLYSTPDYDGDPNIYRWNYFYTPVQIGDTVTGVRIAVRDVVKGTNLTPESQIYNWGIKKAPVDGESRDPKAASLDVSLGASSEGTRPLNSDTTIAQGAEVVKNGDGLGNADAGTVNTPFDQMQAKSDTFHPINENSARRVMNEQNIAPSEVPTVNPDTGNNITKTVSTILNSPLTSEEMKPIYESAIAGGKFDYTVQTDRDAVQRAQSKIARDGWREVANRFIAKAELGQRITKADTTEAISAYNLANAEGDHKAAFELATAIADAAHDSAQMVQAVNLMNRLTPEGKLLTLRKIVDKMNRTQQRKPARTRGKADADLDAVRTEYVDNALGFTISDELATNYFMAETDAERAAAWDSIITDIASQMPSTFREKADFWRYTSMLTNPTTHIRNMAGNLLQMGARKIKNAVGTGRMPKLYALQSENL